MRLRRGPRRSLGGCCPIGSRARKFTVALTWSAPAQEAVLTPLRLHHWDFFFALAALTGLYALHRLEMVQQGEGEAPRLDVRNLALEAFRTFRELSTVIILRDGVAFPFGRLVGRRPRSIRRRP
jgi:hypothetical protein